MDKVNPTFIFSCFLVLFFIVEILNISKANKAIKQCEDKLYKAKPNIYMLLISITLTITWATSLAIYKFFSLTNLILIVLAMETMKEYLFNRLIISSNGVFINKVFFENSRIKKFGIGHHRRHGDFIRFNIEGLEKRNYLDFLIKKVDVENLRTILLKQKFKQMTE